VSTIGYEMPLKMIPGENEYQSRMLKQEFALHFLAAVERTIPRCPSAHPKWNRSLLEEGGRGHQSSDPLK
jgi:hypothetical protein